MDQNFEDFTAQRYRNEANSHPPGSTENWIASQNAFHATGRADHIRWQQAHREGKVFHTAATVDAGFGSFDRAGAPASRAFALPGWLSGLLRFVFGATAALVLLCVALLLLAAAILFGGRWADHAWMQREPAAGMARHALSSAIPDFRMQPAAIYLPARAPRPVFGIAALAEQFARPGKPGALQAQQVRTSAYACQMDATCRAEAGAGTVLESRVRHEATEFLLDRVSDGRETAVDDACFLSMSANTSTTSPSQARKACFRALAIAQRSKQPRTLAAAVARTSLFDTNIWMRLAYALDPDVSVF